MAQSEVFIVCGAQWGDEGKGKLVDALVTESHLQTMVIGVNGGSNAGHTVNVDGVDYHVHFLTSGSFTPGTIQYLGSSKVLEPISLKKEYTELLKVNPNMNNDIFLSERIHITTKAHLFVDSQTGKDIGTTAKGIGPTYATKAFRTGLRLCDVKGKTDQSIRELLQKVYDSLHVYDDSMIQEDLNNIKWVINTFQIVPHEFFRKRFFCKKNYRFIFELSNATMLDITCGTYPYVTSSSCLSSSVFESTFLNIQDFTDINLHIIGVVKSCPTRVGTGAMPSLIDDVEIASGIVERGHEFGVTTGRKRRPGWLDLAALAYSIAANGLTELNITRLDNLSPLDTVKVCVGYMNDSGHMLFYPPTEEKLLKTKPKYVELPGWRDFDFTSVKSYDDLHTNVKSYLSFMEEHLGIPVTYINTGKERMQIIHSCP